MPFDPTKPANNSPVSSSELRNQFTGLKNLIDNIPPMEVSQGQLDDAISSLRDETAHDVSDIEPMDGDGDDPPSQGDFLALRDKFNELLAALKR